MPPRHLREACARQIRLGDDPQLILDTPLAPTLDAADDFHPANPLRP
nr:hypothetical protein [uncultured Sphingomonas sp.]